MEQIGTYEECDTFLELYSLAKKGDNDQVQQLIDVDNVDVDIRYTHGFTPLMWAARVGQTQAATILLERQFMQQAYCIVVKKISYTATSSSLKLRFRVHGMVVNHQHLATLLTLRLRRHDILDDACLDSVRRRNHQNATRSAQEGR